MKKIISVLLTVSMLLLLAVPSYAAYTDMPSDAYYAESALRLQDLGIISGYEDMTFRGGNSISRAEFTKIIVCMMDKSTEATTSTIATGFYDVSSSAWYAPYISYIAGKDIISGYSDGSFHPEDQITLREALTILLRVLGYNEDEVGYFWPNNYVSAAASLGITEGMGIAPTDALTRGDVAVLVDRALFTKPSSKNTASGSNMSSSAKDTYLETLNYTVLKDSLILDNDTASDTVSILSGNLKLNSAVTYIKRTQYPIVEGDVYAYAVLDKDGYLATVHNYTNGAKIFSMSGVINKITDGDNIEIKTLDGMKISYTPDDSFIVYYESNRMSYANAKSRIEVGIDVTFYGMSYGVWNIAVVGSADTVDPVLASSDMSESTQYLGTTPINHNDLTVYRDGKAATISDIKTNDVIYYNTKTNIMDVYSKKVTGTYYAAYPSKAYAESVSVGGKEYKIGYSAATSRLDASSGAFEYGDKVTLLLGKDDKIAFVTDNAQSFDYFDYGVILSTGTRIAPEGPNEGNSEFVATLFMADGEEHEIVTDKKYTDFIGELVGIRYTNIVATLTKRSSNEESYAGEIDTSKRTINGKYVLKDAVVIQRTSEDDAQTATCEMLDFDRISSKKITTTQIINVISANGFGDVAILYVKDFENAYQYGVVAGFVKSGDNKTSGYKIFSKGAQNSYNLSGCSSISTAVGNGVGYRTSAMGITKIVPLVKLDSKAGVTAVEGGRIRLGDKVYSMADDVQIADISDTTRIKSITIEELQKLKSVTSVAIYSDKSVAAGGLVRVVTIVCGK